MIAQIAGKGAELQKRLTRIKKQCQPLARKQLPTLHEPIARGVRPGSRARLDGTHAIKQRQGVVPISRELSRRRVQHRTKDRHLR
jgi:hypothetical protein